MSKSLFAAVTCAALAFAGLAVGGCASGGEDAPVQVASGGLALEVASPDRIAGTYTRDGVVVRFDARHSESGNSLLLRGKDERVLVSTVGVGATRVVSFLDGRVTFQPPSVLSSPEAQLFVAAPSDGPPGDVAMTGEESAFGELMFTDEAQILPWLSRALGERGFTGRSHPASLDLHTLGAMVARVREVDVPPMPPVLADGTDDVRTAQASCERPVQDQCFGMCGPGCNCWSWVCGDCCLHRGCAAHDSDCRKCSWSHPMACARCASFASFWSGGGC